MCASGLLKLTCTWIAEEAGGKLRYVEAMAPVLDEQDKMAFAMEEAREGEG